MDGSTTVIQKAAAGTKEELLFRPFFHSSGGKKRTSRDMYRPRKRINLSRCFCLAE